jgi:hypothetical protein
MPPESETTEKIPLDATSLPSADPASNGTGPIVEPANTPLADLRPTPDSAQNIDPIPSETPPEAVNAPINADIPLEPTDTALPNPATNPERQADGMG